jgi:hypothetical protein
MIILAENPADRLAEIAEILAVGLQRHVAWQSSEFSAEGGESLLHFTPDQSGHANQDSLEKTVKAPVLAQLAALKGASAPALKVRWRALFDSEPPPYNRRFLESRLAYRIQELAYGGLKKETVERLRALGKQYNGKPGEKPKGRSQRLPIAGTRLIREWQGAEHSVTVRGDDFEYQGRPYKSLSAIARDITGVRWNGWVFFGLKNHHGAA